MLGRRNTRLIEECGACNLVIMTEILATILVTPNHETLAARPYQLSAVKVTRVCGR